MAKKFNLADFLPAEAGVSESDTMAISLIPWDRILVNDANFYKVGNVDDLVNSIQMHGLMDPVTVTPDEEGRYRLISGHRRHKAWGILRKQDPEKYAQIPAIVRSFESPSMAELALIMANSSSRVLTPAEVGRQAERVEMLLYELKEQGYTFDGRMRDQVAKACQVSSSKLARLKVIRENLAAPWTELWEAGKLAEDPAYKLARLPAEFQERLGKVLRSPTGKQISSVAEQYEEGYRWDNPNDLKCPDGSACHHGNSFLLHDAKCYRYSRCHGKTCCLECREAFSNYGACQSACSKAAAVRKKQQAEEEAKAEASRKRKKTKLQKAMTASAIRLVRALDAGDPVADNEKILTGWYCSLTAGEVRAIAAGTFEEWDRLRSSNDPLRPDHMEADTVRKLANLTGASADFLMGLSDEPFPEKPGDPSAVPRDDSEKAPRDDSEKTPLEVWEEEGDMFIRFDWRDFGDPEDGRYLCTVDLGSGDLHEQMLDRLDGVWKAYGRPVDDMFTVKAWWPLPPRWERPWVILGRSEDE